MATTPPATSVTIPTLSDPSEILTAQIAEAEKNMESLRPAVEAFKQWEQFAASLTAVRDGKPASGSSNRAGRGDRPEQFLALLGEAGDEGLTIAEAARQMGMSGPNYLYRIVPELVEEGKVVKNDKTYVLATSEAPESTKDESKGDSPE